MNFGLLFEGSEITNRNLFDMHIDVALWSVPYLMEVFFVPKGLLIIIIVVDDTSTMP